MKTDNKMVLIFLSFLAVARCTDLQPLASSDEENRLEPTAGVVDGGDPQHPETIVAESTTTAAAVDGHRSGRQFYQQPFAYQPYPQRRAYHKSPGHSKKRLNKYRTKPGGGGGRRGLRPRRRPSMSGPPLSMSGPPTMSGPPPQSMATGSRYRRLPGLAPVMRPQHVNYIDAAGGADYDDGFEPAPLLPVPSFDYGEFDHESANNFAYGPQTVAAGGGRSRKRPVAAAASAVGYADETRPTAIVHVPVRVVRPVALPTPSTTAAAEVTTDPMEKLRRLVHEAMDEHFANRHQELYGEGFGKQQQHQSNSQQVYSAKYKRQQAEKHNQPQWSAADAVRPAAATQSPSAAVKTAKDADVDADGSDDRLTLAEISAYMGAKPAETVLSAGGHRYVLSDALQQSYRHQQQQHHQQQQQQQQQYDGGEDRHQSQYLRYVSPFEALYELPAARWTYK
ncbi:box A-binding factor-like [Aphis gossypii]|uniref:box A-binding factor-like n=1 Tax=Aphis gossypii TaxID=80765 RepID=UPI0021590F92|nr:box A-binding factor-like [Aphis gossypii]